MGCAFPGTESAGRMDSPGEDAAAAPQHVPLTSPGCALGRGGDGQCNVVYFTTELDTSAVWGEGSHYARATLLGPSCLPTRVNLEPGCGALRRHRGPCDPARRQPQPPDARPDSHSSAGGGELALPLAMNIGSLPGAIVSPDPCLREPSVPSPPLWGLPDPDASFPSRKSPCGISALEPRFGGHSPRRVWAPTALWRVLSSGKARERGSQVRQPNAVGVQGTGRPGVQVSQWPLLTRSPHHEIQRSQRAGPRVSVGAVWHRLGGEASRASSLALWGHMVLEDRSHFLPELGLLSPGRPAHLWVEGHTGRSGTVAQVVRGVCRVPGAPPPAQGPQGLPGAAAELTAPSSLWPSPMRSLLVVGTG